MAKASESDLRMMIATQVAYLDASPGTKVSDVIDRTISRYEGRSGLSAMEKAQLEYAQNLKAAIEKNRFYDCNYWVVKEVSDDNQRSGFYGCLIDTRDGDAIVGFRGSETAEDGNQLVKDWGRADFGLLNNDGTTLQQRMAQEFTRQIHDRYGSQYDSFSFSGHSLGGNLAEHAAVTAPEGMSIHRCTSYDGPGFSDEYLRRYADQIARRSRYIDHYQYSLVGFLLNPLPGSNYQTIAAHDGSGKWPFSLLTRHSTENIEFDGYGNVQKGTRDPLSAAVGPASRGIENGPPAGLWSNCPSLAILWAIAEAGPELLSAMKDQAKQMVASIQTMVQGIRDAVRNWFCGMFGVGLTGDFEVSVSFVNAVGGGLDSAGRKLQRISSELDGIAASLRYNSIAGSYYRFKLRSISRSLSNDQKKAANLAGAVRDCGRFASSSDAKAAQIFRTV